MIPAVHERRKSVLRAVAAVETVPHVTGGVLAHHVSGFGLPACVDLPMSTIIADLRWLTRETYLERVSPAGRTPTYRTTPGGRQWAAPPRAA